MVLVLVFFGKREKRATLDLWTQWQLLHEQLETNIIFLVPFKLVLSLNLPKLVTDPRERSHFLISLVCSLGLFETTRIQKRPKWEETGSAVGERREWQIPVFKRVIVQAGMENPSLLPLCVCVHVHTCMDVLGKSQLQKERVAALAAKVLVPQTWGPEFSFQDLHLGRGVKYGRVHLGSQSWGDKKKISGAHWLDSLPELGKPPAIVRPRLKRKKKKQEKTWVVMPKVQHLVVWTTGYHMRAHTHDHIQAQKWIKWKSVTNLKGQGKRDLSQVFPSWTPPVTSQPWPCLLGFTLPGGEGPVVHGL